MSEKWYCNRCKTSMDVVEEQKDESIVIQCSKCGRIAHWSPIETELRKCGICGQQLLRRSRTRLDKKTPKGTPIIRLHPKDVRDTFNHFAENHPEILRKCPLVKVK